MASDSLRQDVPRRAGLLDRLFLAASVVALLWPVAKDLAPLLCRLLP